MKRKEKKIKEIRVGAFIIIALALIVAFVFSIGGQKKLFGDKVKYNILFDSTGGLFEGDPVYLTGVEIGNVTRVWFPEDIQHKKILVEITVLAEIAPRIRRDTRARIAAASLVYGKLVELSMGSIHEDPIPPGEFIEAVDPTNYGAIVDSTNLMVDDIRRILMKINQGEGMLGMLVNEPLELKQTLHHLALSSRRLASMLARVDEGKSPLGVLFSDSVEIHQTIDDIRKTVSGLEEVSVKLKGTESVVGRLINDPDYGQEVTVDLRNAVRSIANITAKIDSGYGTLGMLVNDPELYAGLEDVVLGVKKSSLTKWMIQNRRKAGEKERLRREEAEAP